MAARPWRFVACSRERRERVGREVARNHRGAALFEYWPFLDAYCDLASDEGLRLLDNHLHDEARSQ